MTVNTMLTFHSTGGIVALALGVKGWTVDKCIDKFLYLCDQAFTPREMHGIFGLQAAATINHGSIYRTRPLHHALKSSFGDNLLFGGYQNSTECYEVKTAVTSTDGAGKKDIVLSNYNRQGKSEGNHEFYRPSDPKFEMKIWEAAAATSAAPPYFKSFTHSATDLTYLDGALYYNNPVKVIQRERKFLWPDVADLHPDILLSIGTGQDNETEKMVRERNSPNSRYVDQHRLA